MLKRKSYLQRLQVPELDQSVVAGTDQGAIVSDKGSRPLAAGVGFGDEDWVWAFGITEIVEDQVLPS